LQTLDILRFNWLAIDSLGVDFM